MSQPRRSFNKSAGPLAQRFKSFLHAVATGDEKGIAEFVRDYPKQISRKGSNGNTALHVAASKGKNISVRALIAAGAQINAKNIYGDTPLMTAASEGHKDVVETLVAAGADLSLKNKSNITALISAQRARHRSIAGFLEDAENSQRRRQARAAQNKTRKSNIS